MKTYGSFILILMLMIMIFILISAPYRASKLEANDQTPLASLTSIKIPSGWRSIYCKDYNELWDKFNELDQQEQFIAKIVSGCNVNGCAGNTMSRQYYYIITPLYLIKEEK